MAQFIALTSKGLGAVLKTELEGLGVKVLKASQSRVSFDCNWRNLYRVSLSLRSCTRILLPILDFSAYNADDLYNNCKKHDFTKYIEPMGSLKVEVSSQGKGPFNNSIFVAQKIKDAIVDQFYKKYDKRPNVDFDHPDLIVSVRIKGANVSLAIDVSGQSLSHRGYRVDHGPAPLREHLAAGLILMTGWTGQCPLIDPMCGSGTFLVEAGLIAHAQAPGLQRHSFAFQNLKSYDKSIFDEVVTDLLDNEKNLENEPLLIMGSDHDPRALEAANANISRSSVLAEIQTKQMSVYDYNRKLFDKSEATEGIIVVNPPYGERMDEKGQLVELYTALGKLFKSQFSGWQAWVLSGNTEYTQYLGMKSDKSYSVFNGSIECRWLRYPLR